MLRLLRVSQRLTLYLSQVERRTEVVLQDAKLQKMSQEMASLLAAHNEVLARCLAETILAQLSWPRCSTNCSSPAYMRP